MSEMKECKKCHRITTKLLEPEGICFLCFQESLPKCQYPGCQKTCEKDGDILCHGHFLCFVNGKFNSKLEDQFIEKFAEIGRFYKIRY